MSRILRAIKKAQQEKQGTQTGSGRDQSTGTTGETAMENRRHNKASWISTVILVIVFGVIVAGEAYLYLLLQEEAEAVQSIRSTLHTIKDDLARSTSQSDTAASGMQEVVSKLDAVESKNRETLAKITTVENDISRVKERIAAVKEVDTSAFESEVDGVKKTLSELQDKIYFLLLKQARSSE